MKKSLFYSLILIAVVGVGNVEATNVLKYYLSLNGSIPSSRVQHRIGASEGQDVFDSDSMHWALH